MTYSDKLKVCDNILNGIYGILVAYINWEFRDNFAICIYIKNIIVIFQTYIYEICDVDDDDRRKDANSLISSKWQERNDQKLCNSCDLDGIWKSFI